MINRQSDSCKASCWLTLHQNANAQSLLKADPNAEPKCGWVLRRKGGTVPAAMDTTNGTPLAASGANVMGARISPAGHIIQPRQQLPPVPWAALHLTARQICDDGSQSPLAAN